MIVKNATPIRIYLTKLLSRWRVFLGFCPMCNSDAPAVDNCPLCESYRMLNTDTPSSGIKVRWLEDYDQVLDSMASTRKLVAKAKHDI